MPPTGDIDQAADVDGRDVAGVAAQSRDYLLCMEVGFRPRAVTWWRGRINPGLGDPRLAVPLPVPGRSALEFPDEWVFEPADAPRFMHHVPPAATV